VLKGIRENVAIEFIGFVSTREQSELIPPTGPVVDVGYTRAFARTHEEAGFDRVLIGYQSSSPDGFIVAADVLAHTEKLGVLLAHRPGFVSPTVAARKLATLDQFSGGRLAVHTISGGSDQEQRRDGDYLDHDARYRRTGEYLQILKSIWTAESPLDHHGEYYSFEGAYSDVRSVTQPHIPIYFGGASDIAIEIAAQYADVYALWGEPLADASAQIQRVKEAAARYGRNPEISLSLRPILASTEDQAWERAYSILDTINANVSSSRYVRRDLTNVGSLRLLEAASRGDVHDKRLFTALAKASGAPGNSTSLVGTPNDVVESLLDYIDIGVTKILIRGYDPIRDAEAYSELIRLTHQAVAARESTETVPSVTAS
jgi:alkanesulfonate monooxygenase